MIKGVMKKHTLIFSFVLMISNIVIAQQRDSIPARSIAEKGAQGDLILGKKIKKDQLLSTPPALQSGDSLYKTETPSKRKKNRHKKI